MAVQAGQKESGPWTDWSDVAEWQLDYYLWPADAFSVRLVRSYRLARPITVCSRCTRKTDSGTSSKILSRGPWFVPFTTLTGAEMLQSQVLSDSDRDFANQLRIAEINSAYLPQLPNMQDLPCLLLPPPCMTLLFQGGLKELVLRAEWERNLQLDRMPANFGNVWPGQTFLDERADVPLQPHPSERDIELTVANLGFVIQCFRRLVRKALPEDALVGADADHDEEARAGEVLNWEFALEMLVCWRASLCVQSGQMSAAASRRRRIHTSEKLIEAVSLSRRVRGAGRVPDVVVKSLSVGLPQCLATGLVAHAKKNLKQKLPSTSSVRRSEIALDVAFMLGCRDIWAAHHGSLRYLWADSSPQATRSSHTPKGQGHGLGLGKTLGVGQLRTLVSNKTRQTHIRVLTWNLHPSTSNWARDSQPH